MGNTPGNQHLTARQAKIVALQVLERLLVDANSYTEIVEEEVARWFFPGSVDNRNAVVRALLEMSGKTRVRLGRLQRGNWRTPQIQVSPEELDIARAGHLKEVKRAHRAMACEVCQRHPTPEEQSLLNSCWYEHHSTATSAPIYICPDCSITIGSIYSQRGVAGEL